MAGKYFEELIVGEVFHHQPGRTITEMDNILFSCLTMNPQPLHLDEEFAKKTEFPKPVFHGDTLFAETEVVEKRESRSRPDAGIMFFEHRATNQRGEIVARCRRTALMKKKA